MALFWGFLLGWFVRYLCEALIDERIAKAAAKPRKDA